MAQLKNSDFRSEERTSPHHLMFSGTLVNAQEKNKKCLISLAYLLDRWARLPGVRNCDILIQEVFCNDDDVQTVIKEIIQYL